MSDCKLVLVKEDVRFVVETGMQGPPGKSTYDLAVREGYSGTLQDWLTEQGVADIQLFQDSVDDLQQDLSHLDQTKANDADISDVGKSGQYSGLLNIPSEFTPASHTHVEADITDLDKYGQTEVDNKLSLKADDVDISLVGKSGSYNDLLNVPSEFTPSAHTHVESDITDLDKYSQTEVDNKLALKADDSSISTVGKTGSYNDLLNKPDLSVLEEVLVYDNQTLFPTTGESGKVYIAQDTGYMYRWSGVEYVQLTDQTAIWGQVSGDIANQTDLQNALAGKSDVGHTHIEADITDLDKYSQTEVDNKLSLKADDSSISDVGKSGEYSDLLNIPSTFTPEAHTHTESDITDLDKYTQAQTDSLLADKWDKQAVVQATAFTAQANTRYWLTGTGTVTLPASANTGDKIELGKVGGTVNVSGQVVYEGTTDTNLEWDMETKLILVWNGSAWSVQLD